MNAYFGKMVRAMRLQRWYLDDNGDPKSWSRVYLAAKTQPLQHSLNGQPHGLSAHQIRDIEAGSVALLRPDLHLAPLAHAFQLSEPEKAEFYAAAGYIYNMQEPQVDVDHARMNLLLQQLPYPTAVFTPLGDILGFNTYFRDIYSYTPQVMQALHEAPIGANIMRAYFEPIFNPRQVLGGGDAEKWREQAERSIRAFRLLSLQYVATPRYKQLLAYMKQMPEFDKLWDYCNRHPLDDYSFLVYPFGEIYHPLFHTIRIMKLSIPPAYLGRNIVIFGHFPVSECETIYRQFQDTISHNQVFTFPSNLSL